MPSYGEFNGSLLNEFAINDGGFYQEMGGSATMPVAARGVSILRSKMTSSSGVSFACTTTTTRRLVSQAKALLPVKSGCTMRRRPVMMGGASVLGSAQAQTVRRLVEGATMVVVFAASSQSAWRSYRPTHRTRRAYISEDRTIIVPKDDRRIALNADRRAVVVPRDRGVI